MSSTNAPSPDVAGDIKRTIDRINIRLKNLDRWPLLLANANELETIRSIFREVLSSLTPPKQDDWQREAFAKTVALAESNGMIGAGDLGLPHLQDMLRTIQADNNPQHPSEGFSQAKLGRWLGWAQAAVVAADCATLNDMKEINITASRAAKPKQDDALERQFGRVLSDKMDDARDVGDDVSVEVLSPQVRSFLDKATAEITQLRAALASAHADARDSTVGAQALTIVYTNWRGETAERRIIPVGVWFGATEWHPEPQWLVKAIDVEKGAERDFAWAGIDFQGEGSSLAAARADGAREASKAANEVHEYYAGVRDRTPTGTPAHDVAQECVIASDRTWRAVAALLPDQCAAIRALINKDAGGV